MNFGHFFGDRGEGESGKRTQTYLMDEPQVITHDKLFRMQSAQAIVSFLRLPYSVHTILSTNSYFVHICICICSSF